MTDVQNAIFAEIEGLPEEVKNLLVVDALLRIDSILEDISKGGQSPSEAQALAGLARSVVHVAGYTASKVRESHDDWHSSGDTRIDKVWESMADLMRGLTLDIDSLPEGTRDRLRAGTATDEDRKAIKDMVRKTSGVDLDDQDIEVITLTGDHGHDHGTPKATEPEPQTGMYL